MGNFKNIAVERVRVHAPADSSTVETEKPRRKTGRRVNFLPTVEWSWLCRMAAMPGKAGWVGVAIYRLTVMRNKTTVTFCCRQLAQELGVNRKAVGNAMNVLEAGGFIRAQRGRGSFATVELLVVPEV